MAECQELSLFWVTGIVKMQKTMDYGIKTAIRKRKRHSAE